MLSLENETVWKRITLYLLTFAVLVLCGFVLLPFFSALVGATILAVITRHPYDWLSKKIRNRSLCAAVGLTIVVLAVVVPVFFLSQEFAEQALDAITALRAHSTQQKLSEFLGRHPDIASRIKEFTDSVDLNNTARKVAGYLGSNLVGMLKTSVRIITQVVVMLFILFFLLRDRALALGFLRSILPLREDESTNLLNLLDDTIDATALGRLAIAGVQGVLAGLAYWILGVPGPILLAFTTALMSMIPAFGTFLVWGPIAIYLGMSGHWGKAAMLAIWGGVIVGSIDNFLYPILVGTRLRAHTVIILLSILGGISLFGITGIILGPVTFTLAATLLDFWRARTKLQPTSSGPTS